MERNFQLNVDLTVAMPCHCWVVALVKGQSADPVTDLTIDLRDAVGDRLHLSDDFVKDGVRHENDPLSIVMT